MRPLPKNSGINPDEFFVFGGGYSEASTQLRPPPLCANLVTYLPGGATVSPPGGAVLFSLCGWVRHRRICRFPGQIDTDRGHRRLQGGGGGWSGQPPSAQKWHKIDILSM